MPPLAAAFLFGLAGILAHCNFVQLWMKERGGLAYIWNLSRNNLALNLIRATLVTAVLCAVLMGIESLRVMFAYAAGALFFRTFDAVCCR